jgi:uncharacterized protein
MFIVMAKKPGAAAKTRLSPALSESQRTDLARAFIRDKASALRSLDVPSRFVVAPPDEPESLRELVGVGLSLRAQVGADLGERLSHAADEALREGSPWVALIDADTPTLPPWYLAEAKHAFEAGVNVVLGPAKDGGYYLIGMREPYADLFEGIAWSTETVFTATVAKLGTRTVHVLPEWYDIDTPRELEQLRAELVSMSRFRPGFPSATAAVLGLLRT